MRTARAILVQPGIRGAQAQQANPLAEAGASRLYNDVLGQCRQPLHVKRLHVGVDPEGQRAYDCHPAWCSSAGSLCHTPCELAFLDTLDHFIVWHIALVVAEARIVQPARIERVHHAESIVER
jgi:hypothetical protein